METFTGIEFNVGDLVIVRKPASIKHIRGAHWDSKMDVFDGKTYRISDTVLNGKYHLSGVYGWVFVREWLEKYDKINFDIDFNSIFE